MQLKFLKFLIPFTIFFGAILSFHSHGWVIALPLFFAWLFIPIMEFVVKPNPANMNAAEEELAKKNKGYDVLLYLVVAVQYFALYEFLYSMKNDALTWLEITGRIFVMGLLCGVFGINVGHELGHRVNKFEQSLAKARLLT